MQPIEHRARELMDACPPSGLANMLAEAERALQMRVSAFDGGGEFTASMRRLDEAERAERDALALIQNAAKGDR